MFLSNFLNDIKRSYNVIYKDDRLKKLVKELDNSQKYTKEFLRNNDPYSAYYCTIRQEKCASCGLLVWEKDSNHRYITANDVHLDIFYQRKDIKEVIGKTDEELIKKWREETGIENTFGEMCISTDEYIKRIKQPTRFFEFGYRAGKPLLLDVFKTPLFNDKGEFIGSNGNALDLSSRESDIVDLLQFYMSIGIAKRLDSGKTKSVATYLISDRRKRFNREFPQ